MASRVGNGRRLGATCRARAGGGSLWKHTRGRKGRRAPNHGWPSQKPSEGGQGTQLGQKMGCGMPRRAQQELGGGVVEAALQAGHE